MSGLQPGAGPFSWGDATPSSGEEMVGKNVGTNDANLASAPQIVSSEPTFNPFQTPPTRGHIPHTFEAGEIPMEEWHSDEESSDQVTHIEYGDITEPATEHSINNTAQKRNDPELAYPYIKSQNQEIEELEEYPSDELGQAAELQSPKLPWYWRVYYAFFPATQEEFRPWFFGVLLDIFFLIIIIVLLVSLYYDDPGKIEEAWFFPFLGIFGAIISTSTPAGGGVVFFPFMVLIDVKAQEAAAFSMTTQAFSMGVFGAGQWIRKAPKGLIVYWMVFVVVAASWGGVITSMLLLPITNGGALEAFFLIFVILLAIYVLYGLVRGELQTQNSKVKRTLPNVVALLILGLLGGMLVGYIAVGIDIMFFILMTFIYKANSNMATVDSILIMGWSCWLPAFLNIVAFDDLKFNFVLMTLIGSLIGARIGPALNILLGRRNVLIAFEVLLVIEILRAIAFLFLAPLIFSGSEFFWTANYSD